MLTFRYDGAEGKMIRSEVLTTGMVGTEVRLEFSDDWDGLAKTAVFTAGDVTRDVVNVSQVVTIPAEVLAQPHVQMFVGVWGVSGDGVVRPTVMAQGPFICEGTDPTGDVSLDPTLPVWGQLQEQVDAMARTLENQVLELDLRQINVPFTKSGHFVCSLSNLMDTGPILDAMENRQQIRLIFENRRKPFTMMLDNWCIGDRCGECSGTMSEILEDGSAMHCIVTAQIYRPDNALLVFYMNPTGGVSEEMIGRINEAIGNLPVRVADDGYTDIQGLRQATSIRTAREGNTITMTTVLEGGVVCQDIITLNEQDVPVSVVVDGVECELAFEDLAAKKWLCPGDFGLSVGDVLVNGTGAVPVTEAEAATINSILSSRDLLGMRLHGDLGEGEAEFVFYLMARGEKNGTAVCNFSMNGSDICAVSCTGGVLRIGPGDQ